MAKQPKPFWHKTNQCWCSCIGDVSEKTGRRKPVYFREIPYGPKGSPNFRKVQAAIDEHIASRPVAVVVHSTEPTFDDLSRKYLVWLENRVHSGKSKPLTYTGHQKALDKFSKSPGFGGTPHGKILARDFTATMMSRFIDGMANADRGVGKPRGYGPNYIGRILASVQTVLNWAAAPRADRAAGDPERLIPENPVKGFSHEATRAPHSPTRFVAEAQVRKFFDWGYARAETYSRAGKRAAPGGWWTPKHPELDRWFERIIIDLIRVAYLTGTRPGEVRVARWVDYEPEAVRLDGIDGFCGRITLDPTRWKSGNKTGKHREILLEPEAVSVIEGIRADPKHHPVYIWTHGIAPHAKDRDEVSVAHGVPWGDNALTTRVCTLRRSAIADGIRLEDVGPNRFVMYLLRHTRAAELLMGGVPIATVAQLLGTSVQMIQNTYGSYSAEHLAEAVTRGLPRSVQPPIPPSP